MTEVGVLLAGATKRLAAAGIDSARADSRLLLAHALGVAPSDLFQLRNVVTPVALESYLARRANREPVGYITGAREFWSLVFEIGPGVLVPRPETETLVEQAMREFPDHLASLDVLDLGTGSACLPVAFLSEFPRASALAVDSSADALRWAGRNVKRNWLDRRCELREADWTDGLERAFDVVFCNPPYIETAAIASLDPEVSKFEPWAALDGGKDGLDAYRALAPRIASHLNQSGRAFVELGADQAAPVRHIFAASGLETLRVVPDLSGIERCLVAVRAV